MSFWTSYAGADNFAEVFGVAPSFSPSMTLLDALWLGGGGERALARHAVAALLNASRTDYAYPLAIGDVIAGVQQTYATGNFSTFKNTLDAANNIGCPLGLRHFPAKGHLAERRSCVARAAR